jgi:hypothetical protein
MLCQFQKPGGPTVFRAYCISEIGFVTENMPSTNNWRQIGPVLVLFTTFTEKYKPLPGRIKFEIYERFHLEFAMVKNKSHGFMVCCSLESIDILISSNECASQYVQIAWTSAGHRYAVWPRVRFGTSRGLVWHSSSWAWHNSRQEVLRHDTPNMSIFLAVQKCENQLLTFWQLNHQLVTPFLFLNRILANYYTVDLKIICP